MLDHVFGYTVLLFWYLGLNIFDAFWLIGTVQIDHDFMIMLEKQFRFGVDKVTFGNESQFFKVFNYLDQVEFRFKFFFSGFEQFLKFVAFSFYYT